MVKLRLKRIGKRKSAFYRIVVSDSRVQRDGKYIELLGTYNPINSEVKLDKELSIKWLFNGAQPTDTVRNILSKQGILKTFHEQKIAIKLANKVDSSANSKKHSNKEKNNSSSINE